MAGMSPTEKLAKEMGIDLPSCDQKIEDLETLMNDLTTAVPVKDHVPDVATYATEYDLRQEPPFIDQQDANMCRIYAAARESLIGELEAPSAHRHQLETQLLINTRNLRETEAGIPGSSNEVSRVKRHTDLEKTLKMLTEFYEVDMKMNARLMRVCMFVGSTDDNLALRLSEACKRRKLLEICGDSIRRKPWLKVHLKGHFGKWEAVTVRNPHNQRIEEFLNSYPHLPNPTAYQAPTAVASVPQFEDDEECAICKSEMLQDPQAEELGLQGLKSIYQCVLCKQWAHVYCLLQFYIGKQGPEKPCPFCKYKLPDNEVPDDLVVLAAERQEALAEHLARVLSGLVGESP